LITQSSASAIDATGTSFLMTGDILGVIANGEKPDGPMPDDLFKSGMPGVGSERRKHHARLKAEFSLFPENLVPPGSQATTRRGAPDWCLSSAWHPCGRSI